MKNFDSDDYSTDEGKRKRDKEEEFAVSARNKKTFRTPTKVISAEEEKLNEIMMILKGLANDIQEVKKEQKEIRRDQKDYIEEIMQLRKENENVKNECEKIRIENTEIKKDLEGLKRKLEQIEKASKMNNLIITGIDFNTQNETELKEEMKSFINKQLNININAKRVMKIADKVYKFELEDNIDKERILRNKHMLRQMKETQVYINEDLTYIERKKKIEIKKRAKELSAEGKNVKIGYNKLTVDGQEWRWNNNTNELEPKN